MSKESAKLWQGFAAGMAAGLFIAQSSFSQRRTPNAGACQLILREEDGQIH